MIPSRVRQYKEPQSISPWVNPNRGDTNNIQLVSKDKVRNLIAKMRQDPNSVETRLNSMLKKDPGLSPFVDMLLIHTHACVFDMIMYDCSKADPIEHIYGV